MTTVFGSSSRIVGLALGLLLLVTGVVPGGAAASDKQDREPGPEVLWMSRHNPPERSAWTARDGLGLSPDGATVYVSAQEGCMAVVPHPVSMPVSCGGWAIIAYDAATGEQQWINTDSLPAKISNTSVVSASSLAVSPDGASVYVTGQLTPSCGLRGCAPGAEGRFVTRAYNAATGEERWTAIHEPAVVALLEVHTIKVNPDGATVYISGFAKEGRHCHDGGFCHDYVTLAYDAETGEELWFKRFSHWEGTGSFGLDLDISPDGSTVYVTGESRRPPSDDRSDGADYVTVAYDATTGEELWVSVFEALEFTRLNLARGHLRVSPDGATVYLTGISDELSGPLPPGSGCSGVTAKLVEYATVAYDAATGEEQWVSRFLPEGYCRNTPEGLTLSPDGGVVYVTGQHLAPWQPGTNNVRNWGTVAYDAATGEELWADIFDDGPPVQTGRPTVGGDPRDLAVSADGSTLYITGRSWEGVGPLHYDYLTLSYDAATGEQRWNVRFDGLGEGQGDIPTTLAVSPDDTIVYVTGESANADGVEALTIAYRVGDGADPDPSPTPSPTPTPTGSPTPTPTPSESPAPDTTEVSFTARSATSGQYSDEALFEASLTDSGGDPIAGAELSFELTGAESSRSFTATTDADGVAADTPTLDEKPGPYQLTVRYAGDDDHEPSADTTSFVVDKEDSALELTEEKGKDKALVARLSDADTPEDGIAGRTIDFYAGTELLGSATTDDDGVATFEPPQRKGKKEPYEARFEGDDFYLGSSGQGSGKGGKGGKGGGG